MASDKADFSPQYVALEKAMAAPGGVMMMPFESRSQAIAYRHKMNRARIRNRAANNGWSKFDVLSIGLDDKTLVIRKFSGEDVRYIIPATGENGTISAVMQAAVASGLGIEPATRDKLAALEEVALRDMRVYGEAPEVYVEPTDMKEKYDKQLEEVEESRKLGLELD